MYEAQLTKVTLPGNPYAHDTAIGVRLVLSIHIYNGGTPNIGPFQIKVTDLDTGLIDAKQYNANSIGNGTAFDFGLHDVEEDDNLLACVQRYDTEQNLCQDRTVAL